MNENAPRRRSACPIAFTLELLGDKWTLLVLRDLVFMGKKYFREFLEAPEGIATNILTTRLRNLEQTGIVTRRPDPENARRVIYGLTEKGCDLIPLLLDMIVWGAKYDAKTAAPPDWVKRAVADREGMIEDLRAACMARVPKPSENAESV